jgi:Uracil DNA glycosylase
MSRANLSWHKCAITPPLLSDKQDWGSRLRDAFPEPWASRIGEEVKGAIQTIGNSLAERVGIEQIVPHPDHVFRALRIAPEDVGVVIVGQDPYPNASHGMGLSFFVPAGTTPLPGSARNIGRELASDMGLALPDHCDLRRWVERGVMMLNRHLTWAVGSPGGHQSLGWDTVPNRIIDVLAEAQSNWVGIVWGKQAAQLIPRFGSAAVVQSAHPSPLSAHRGFYG